MKRRTAIIGGEHVEVTWNETESEVEATVNGRTYRLDKRRIDGGTVWLGWNGISMEAIVAPQDAGYEVSIRGKRIPVEFVESGRRARRHGAVSDGAVSVRAPMPGKIVRVLLEKDAEVKAGQGIVVMEAMKMQNEIRSPKQGKIVELRVAEGNAVKLGDLIAEVE